MPTSSHDDILYTILERFDSEILAEWLAQQMAVAPARGAHTSEAELRQQSREFVMALRDSARAGNLETISGADWERARAMLQDLSARRAQQGLSSSETAMFVFSLKQPLFAVLQRELAADPRQMGEQLWKVSSLLDKLGLWTIECYQKSREEVINRQQEELLELSTPVVRLWNGILALPLIGTLDSNRTQVVMESLLQEIVTTGAPIAIIDITGVPTVDTLVAQHLLKTVAAARLMGADCIISGIRPQIAQTIVHLGVELTDVITKATLADAFGVALQRVGLAVMPVREAEPHTNYNGAAPRRHSRPEGS